MSLVVLLLQMFSPLVCVPPFGSVDALTAPVTGQTFQCAARWDTTQVPDGWHTLTIRAFDRAGNTAEHSLAVYVNNATPPALPPPSGLQVR